jgi:hypothetical protein
MNSFLLVYFHYKFSSSGEESLTSPEIFLEKAITDSIILKVMQSVLSSAPTTFELFMRLPLELRLMIWDLSKYDPRIIFAGSMSPQHRYCLNSLTYQPLPALPAGFQVHQESRRHFLKTYQALFFFSRGGGTTLYINPKVDMLLFYTISVDDPPADKATIERMAWHYGGPAWLIFGPKWSHIAIYPALKEVVILWSHDLDCEWNLGHWSEERRWAEMSVGKPDHWVKGNKIDRFFCATKGEDGELPLPGKRSEDESRLRWSDGYVFRRIEQ